VLRLQRHGMLFAGRPDQLGVLRLSLLCGSYRLRARALQRRAYQDVSNSSGSCSVPSGSPNGRLADSTYSTLSHELFETLSDPDPPTGWTVTADTVLFGNEIGDNCEFAKFVFKINGKKYETQLEYSNRYHGCVTVP